MEHYKEIIQTYGLDGFFLAVFLDSKITTEKEIDSFFRSFEEEGIGEYEELWARTIKYILLLESPEDALTNKIFVSGHWNAMFKIF